jgi:hypothetical protein
MRVEFAQKFSGNILESSAESQQVDFSFNNLVQGLFDNSMISHYIHTDLLYLNIKSNSFNGRIFWLLPGSLIQIDASDNLFNDVTVNDLGHFEENSDLKIDPSGFVSQEFSTIDDMYYTE